MRFLRSASIPETLWEETCSVLNLPPVLAEAYQKIIDRRGLRELAGDRRESPVGGLNQEQTDKHFAQAFDGSVARVELALLDPKNDVPRVSDALVRSLAGNSVVLTDAPCGAGAATAALLMTIAELRAQSVLPREPLDVTIIGAELSDPAREYFEEIFEEIGPALEEQGIVVDAEVVRWDVTSKPNTVDLVRRIVLASEAKSERLLVVANFNSLLEREKKRKRAQPQIEELFRYSSGERGVAVWIEPQMNRALEKGGVFAWLEGLLRGSLRHFVKGAIRNGYDSIELVGKSTARFRLPLETSSTVTVRLAVMAMNLERPSCT